MPTAWLMAALETPTPRMPTAWGMLLKPFGTLTPATTPTRSLNCAMPWRSSVSVPTTATETGVFLSVDSTRSAETTTSGSVADRDAGSGGASAVSAACAGCAATSVAARLNASVEARGEGLHFGRVLMGPNGPPRPPSTAS